jgi:eukaryotic translation initiation factor 2C
VSRITYKDARQLKFAHNDTQETISVYDFFLTTLEMPLRYPHLPCVMVGDNSRLMYFPMEVCEIVPGQRHQEIK